MNVCKTSYFLHGRGTPNKKSAKEKTKKIKATQKFCLLTHIFEESPYHLHSFN